jgi:hypothetical protein
VFAGEDGASMVNVAAGQAGLVALSGRGYDDGLPITRLWHAADGLTWAPINPVGLPERVVISGLWGASGLYFLRGHLPESDDPGILWRSSDGLTWRQSRDMSDEIFSISVMDGCPTSITGLIEACPIFLLGTKDVDGVIWRSLDGGDTWAQVAVEDAIGWKGVQDAAPIEMRGIVATSDGLLAFGDGLPNASESSGTLHARFWHSADGGSTWQRITEQAPFGELYVRDVAVTGQLVVAVGASTNDRLAVALISADAGRTWVQSITTQREADGTLRQAFPGRAGLIGLGFANPAGTDTFPVREVAWTSDDGTTWRTGAAGDLEGGVVDDAVRFGDLIVAVGRAWTTDAIGTWEAPFGPAVWTLGL